MLQSFSLCNEDEELAAQLEHAETFGNEGMDEKI